MRLISWKVDGFRNLRNTTIDISEGAILAGHNNSGKSNLIRSLFDYKALFSEVEQQTPRTVYNRLPILEREDEQSTSESDGTDEADREVSDRIAYDEWVDDRVSGGARITFQATFRPEPPLSADSFDALGEELRDFVEMVLQNRPARQSLRDTVCESNWFNEFTHKLVISESGIEEEYLATDIEGDRIVIAGRTSDNRICNVIYPMLRIENEEVPREELRLDHISQSKLDRLTSVPDSDEKNRLHREERVEEPGNSNPGSATDDSIWFLGKSGLNTHGAVIHDGLREPIRDDISSWEHVPAVRVPAVADLKAELGPTDATNKQEEIEQLLRFIKSDLEMHRDDILSAYTKTLPDPVDAEIDWHTADTGLDRTALTMRQEESHADDRFYSPELSTGSLQALCIIASVVDHARPQETEGSILAIEEPETHLNPITQRKLLQFINKELGNEVAPILTSHSSTIIDQAQFGHRYVVLKDEASTVIDFSNELLRHIQIIGPDSLSSYLESHSILIVPTRRWKVLFEAISLAQSREFVREGLLLVICETATERALVAHVAAKLNMDVYGLTQTDCSLPESQPFDVIRQVEYQDIDYISEGMPLDPPVVALQKYLDSVGKFSDADLSPLPDQDEVSPEEWITALADLCASAEASSVAELLYEIGRTKLDDDENWTAVLDNLTEQSDVVS